MEKENVDEDDKQLETVGVLIVAVRTAAQIKYR